MNCSKCNAENLDSAKFCKKCGNNLSENDVKQVKRKHSVKISGGKIKFAIIAVVIIGLIGAGAMFLKKKSDEKRILSVEYLEDLDKREEPCKKFVSDMMAGSLNEKEINIGLEECDKYSKEWNKAIETFVAYAKDVKFNDDTEVKGFVEKYKILKYGDDGNAVSAEECNSLVRELKANTDKFMKNTKTNENQAKKFISLIDEGCYYSKQFDSIKIEEKTEQIKAEYTEQENNKIPAGYSIITAEPQNGEKENIVIIFNGEEKGSGEIIIKEPQNGTKMIGSGNSEDIAKQVEDKLNQIVKLWQEQNFTATTILPFLTEEDQSKAPDLESSYKKVIFNWRRFDKVEPILSQVSFKENNKKDYPFISYLPVTVSYYSGNNAPSIPFYYSAKKDEWVSRNDSIAALFEIVKYQSIKAEISPTKFTFAKAGDCKKDKEIEIKSASINGADNFKIDFSVSILYQIKFTLAIDSINSDTKIGYSSSLPITLIDFANKNKSTVLTGKDFEYSSFFDGDCLYGSDILFTFFK